MELLYFIVVFVAIAVEELDGSPTNKQEFPVCASHNSLCDVRFDVSSMPATENTDTICHCPGNVSCATAKTDPGRTFTQEMLSAEETIRTTLSFCDAVGVPKRTCEPHELAVTLRGVGPIIYDIVGDVQCQCGKPLVLVKAIPDGPFSIRKYACGKPICNVYRSDPPVCERVTGSKLGLGLVSELPCHCPPNYHCMVDASQMPIFGGAVEFYCRKVQY